MEVTMVSTTKIVQFNGVPARLWEGKTGAGIPVMMFVTRVAVAQELQTEEAAQIFQRELMECAAPSKEAEAIPLRMII